MQNYEVGFSSASACVETAVIKAAGHNLNLQTNADAAYRQMLSWVDRNVGNTLSVASQPCGTP
jgi:hypothetical protein